MSYNIEELIQSILVWFDKKAVRTRTMKSNGLAKLWCLPLLTCLQFWKTYQPRAQPCCGRKNKAAVRWKVDICASPHFNLPSRRRSYVLYCFVLFCSVLSLIHEIINDINGNKSEKLRSHLPPMWHQWKPAERVLPVASSTGMPELATGSKPVQSGPSRSNSAKYGKNMAKMASTILHNITI